MPKVFSVLLVSFLFLSCAQDKLKDKGVWIGGQIVNPHSNTFVITNGTLIDTLYLDDNNRFLKYYENFSEGVYSIIHEEYQVIYIQPGDSLMIRINTVEFDESMGFTGVGAEQNRFLIDMFLYNELENLVMPQFYILPPEEFVVKADSMYQKRLEILDRFKEKYKSNKGFLEVANASIIYDYYSKLELYPYAYYGRNNITLADLPKGYYDFRKSIDYNNERLQNHYTYYNFLFRHFDNLAYEQYCKQMVYDDENAIHIVHKLHEINKKISLEKLKNNLLNSSIRRYLTRSKYLQAENEPLQLFMQYSTDSVHKEEVEVLFNNSLKLLPGNIYPDVSLENYNGQALLLKSVLKKPTVITFWTSLHRDHYNNSVSKLNELRVKYPEFDFLSININEDGALWKNIVRRNPGTKDFDFRFQQPNKAMNDLVIRAISKVMIVDKNGVILDNNTNIFRIDFEETLLGILNR
ncbi:MAG TPA: hypothetical protein VKZ42_01775 [Flavobacteriaceae bacterium]|nr:hypothetical protein [Flavobacteriaceae bacterium]